ncbi:CBS domain-containing protein, partial [Salmonella enterica subsp. enterica]
EDLVTLDFNAPLKEILALFRRHKFSRYPVYDADRNEFVGLLHIKDLLLELAALDHIPESFNLAELTRPLERVSRHMPLSQLLEQFRKGGAHFA